MTLPPIWPSSLPQTPRRGSWVGGPVEARVQFEADYGPPIERARTTADIEVYSATFPNLSNAVRAVFKAFFAGDLARGINRFAMRDPVTQELGLWKVIGDGRQPYVLTAKQAGWNDLSLSLMKMPGAIWYAPYATATGDLRLPYVVADYENDIFGIDGVRTTASAVAAVTGQFDLYTTATGGAVTEELDKSVNTGGVPATAPTGVTKIVGYRLGDLIDPYAEFDGYLAVSSAADYETDTGVSRWISRTGNTDYDAVQSVGASQPAAAANGLDWDNSNDYMRISQIAADLQAYIAASEDPNFAIAVSVTFTDGDGTPPGFNTDHILFAVAPLSGNGYLQCQILTSGSVRIECRDSTGADTTPDVNLTLDGGFAPGTYEIGLHFHDGVVDTLLNGSLASSNAFDFSALFSANNPFASANCTIGARISNDVTTTGVFSGRYNAFAYKNNPSGALTL